ncbi:unnamed protein product [Caenorhabditis auriculariae]|uniref:Uncharacterized protein n=1 Tax=Caenorhabditis auriculariae TaxID=2777116 RepID=A0A8S1H0I3_9PELO|nr:unnamed protein product [Caenorhabditis auriculariae]
MSAGGTYTKGGKGTVRGGNGGGAKKMCTFRRGFESVAPNFLREDNVSGSVEVLQFLFRSEGYSFHMKALEKSQGEDLMKAQYTEADRIKIMQLTRLHHLPYDDDQEWEFHGLLDSTHPAAWESIEQYFQRCVFEDLSNDFLPQLTDFDDEVGPGDDAFEFWLRDAGYRN